MSQLDQSIQEFQAEEVALGNTANALTDADAKLAAAQTVRDNANTANQAEQGKYYAAGKAVVDLLLAAIAPYAPPEPPPPPVEPAQ